MGAGLGSPPLSLTPFPRARRECAAEPPPPPSTFHRAGLGRTGERGKERREERPGGRRSEGRARRAREGEAGRGDGSLDLGQERRPKGVTCRAASSVGKRRGSQAGGAGTAGRGAGTGARARDGQLRPARRGSVVGRGACAPDWVLGPLRVSGQEPFPVRGPLLEEVPRRV